MVDIYVSAVVMLALSAGLFVACMKLGRRLSRRRAAALMAALIVGVLLYVKLFFHGPFMARLIPVSCLVVLGAWHPFFAAAIGGLAWSNIPKPVWRRLSGVTVLGAVALYSAWQPLLQELPRCTDVRYQGVSIQSSPSTCSAAAAATLLRAYGIEATEVEMARLCLSSTSGTLPWGLYRGLALKTRGTPFAVRMASITPGELRSLPGPAIIGVMLEPGADVDPRYERDWGWRPGLGHTVVLFGFEPDGRIEVGDPGVGRERWSAEALDVLWHGDVTYLVSRR